MTRTELQHRLEHLPDSWKAATFAAAICTGLIVAARWPAATILIAAGVSIPVVATAVAGTIRAGRCRSTADHPPAYQRHILPSPALSEPVDDPAPVEQFADDNDIAA